MRQDRTRPVIYWLWRHSWALYEQSPNRVTGRLFDLLDWLHDRLDY